MADLELQKCTVLTSEQVIEGGSQKPPKADDPMQMRADFVTGDQHLMLECMIEEFAHMGWDANKIAKMFENPFFLASHGLTKRFGSETVREYIEQGIQRCGVLRCAISETKPTPGSQSVTISTSGKLPRRATSKPQKVNSGTLNGDCDYG